MSKTLSKFSWRYQSTSSKSSGCSGNLSSVPSSSTKPELKTKISQKCLISNSKDTKHPWAGEDLSWKIYGGYQTMRNVFYNYR